MSAPPPPPVPVAFPPAAADPIRPHSLPDLYISSEPLYAAAWSRKRSRGIRLAVATIAEEPATNKVSIVERDPLNHHLVETASLETSLPANCVAFIPDTESNFPDLMDQLRIHSIVGGTHSLDIAGGYLKEECVLSERSDRGVDGITSFDWNAADPRLIGTACLDNVVVVYDVEVGSPIISYNVAQRVMACDRGGVADIEFSSVGGGRNIFATAGLNGECTMFDLRRLDRSSIVYDHPRGSPLSRVSWNKMRPELIAIMPMESRQVIIRDIRRNDRPYRVLNFHTNYVNGIAWEQDRWYRICSAGDDHNAIISDLVSPDEPTACRAADQINQVRWGPIATEWISICHGNTLQILRV